MTMEAKMEAKIEGLDVKITVNGHAMRNLPMRWYVEDLQTIVQAVKKLTGNPWDNNRLTYDHHGGLFALALYRVEFGPQAPLASMYEGVEYEEGRSRNTWAAHLYDITGCTGLGNWAYTAAADEPVPERVRKGVADRAEKWLARTVHCSDCDKLIEFEDVAGRYFSGLFCEPCWEETWKEVEARETYA